MQTRTELQLADALLLRFCHRFELIYSKDTVTPNIHLHAHVVDCIRDYGPMSTFWLFAFERFNGILGDEPTNNRSIEIQLMKRFLKDNGHLQLLMSIPTASPDITSTFSKVVLEQVCKFTSVRHLDSTLHEKSDDRIIPATKYTICSFTADEMEILSELYHSLFPNLFTDCEDLYLPYTFRKMKSVTIDGQKLSIEQFILAGNVFDFPCSTTAPSSMFSDVNARPAKIEYFAVHTVQINSVTYVNQVFSVVNWPMWHPLNYCIGRPHEVWCCSTYETNSMNHFLPIDNFVSCLLTAQLCIDNEEVLVTVPVI